MRRRRLAVLGMTAAIAASLATATLMRKPAMPTLVTPLAAQETPAKGIEALTRIEPPRPAPDVSFDDIDGTTHTLHEFAGHVVLLNLWATWCVPCVRELPSLAMLAPKAQAAGIVMLPLSLDRGGTARVRSYFSSNGIDGLPVWNASAGATQQALGVRGIPTTFVIDRQGREVAMLEGAANWGGEGVVEALRKVAP